MADQSPHMFKLQLAAIVAAVVLLGALVWFFAADDEPPPTFEPAHVPDVGSAKDDATRQGSSKGGAVDDLVRVADSVVETIDPDQEPNNGREPAGGGDKTVVELQGGGQVEVPADSPAARAIEARKAADNIEAQAMNNPGPVGPGDWGAPISTEEEAEIQAAFDALPEPDPRVSRADRKTSIEVARAIVEQCFRDLQARQPGRKGRIAVAWMAMSAGGEGVIAEPEITLNLKLRDPTFERCIVQSLDGLTFSAAEPGEPLRVEYPFFFDE